MYGQCTSSGVERMTLQLITLVWRCVLCPTEMCWVLILSSKFFAPMEVDQSLIEVDIIFGCWEEEETPIKILNTCATFSIFVIGEGGVSLTSRAWSSSSLLLLVWCFASFLGSGRLLNMFSKVGAFPRPMVG